MENNGKWSKEVFSRNLQRYMDREGMNQKEMAKVVGVSASAFNDWMKCKKYPRIDKIEILANARGRAQVAFIYYNSLTKISIYDILCPVMRE